MEANAENLKSIVQQGREMARAGHFDSAGILKAVEDFDQRYVANSSPQQIGFLLMVVQPNSSKLRINHTKILTLHADSINFSCFVIYILLFFLKVQCIKSSYGSER